MDINKPGSSSDGFGRLSSHNAATAANILLILLVISDNLIFRGSFLYSLCQISRLWIGSALLSLLN